MWRDASLESVHIDWAVWDRGPAASRQTWLSARCLGADMTALHYTINRRAGGVVVAPRMLEIDDGI